MTVYEKLLHTRDLKGAGYLVLLDPDKIDQKSLPHFAAVATTAGVDGFLIGGSLSLTINFEKCIKTIKEVCSCPLIIFPGGNHQISSNADAILYLSIISGRNPEFLIGQQVVSAPLIKQMGLEPISTGYMLIESGGPTTAEFMSNTRPIPRNKPDIAVAHAIAADFFGMKTVYLDAGSGAELSVPEEMISEIKQNVSIPIIVGGGIRTPEMARKKVDSGASFVVTGTVLEKSDNQHLMREFAEAIHTKLPKKGGT